MMPGEVMTLAGFSKKKNRFLGEYLVFLSDLYTSGTESCTSEKSRFALVEMRQQKHTPSTQAKRVFP
jgi:hypothetical protein